MKKIPRSHSPAHWLTGSLLIGLLLCAALFPGCASAPTAAYKVEQATSVTVDAAMTAWGDYVEQNHPPVAEELAVKSAFETYQKAQLTAIDVTKIFADLASTNSASAGTNTVAAATAAQAKLNTAMAQAAGALADLISLIQTLGVKLQ